MADWDLDDEPPREEPHCCRCCDRGTVAINPMEFDGPRRPCPDCNPTPSDLAHSATKHYIRVGTGNYDPNEVPF
ncbi:hypothetical protein ABZY58_11060 [Micromonospora tulbaghiae]|uniref:hypothetical protein n=1 Tax=Micromonospora tulbaghiae TaxID=479978 RepID=UPI00339FE792